MASEALRFGYGCVVHAGVDLGAGDVEVDVIHIPGNIHPERPIHRVLGTAQIQGTTRQMYNRTTDCVHSIRYNNLDREVFNPSPCE